MTRFESRNPPSHRKLAFGAIVGAMVTIVLAGIPGAASASTSTGAASSPSPAPSSPPSHAVLDKIANTPPSQRTTGLSAPLVSLAGTVDNTTTDQLQVTGSGVAVGGWVTAPPPNGSYFSQGGQFSFSIIQYFYQPNNGTVTIQLPGATVFAPHLVSMFFKQPQSGSCPTVIGGGSLGCETGQSGWSYDFFVTPD